MGRVTTSVSLHLVRTPDPDVWHTHAACAGQHSALFYPPTTGEKKSARLARERRAKAVCAECTVRTECLATAVANNERYGIWGGMTDLERRRRFVDVVR